MTISWLEAQGLKWWQRTFQRQTAITRAVERAVEEQAAFERAHPVPFDLDQRLTALRQRFALVYRATPPADAERLLYRAALDWRAASTAAEETP